MSGKGLCQEGGEGQRVLFETINFNRAQLFSNF